MLSDIPKIFYTIGIPRSGKSTFARWFSHNCRDFEFDIGKNKETRRIRFSEQVVVIDEDKIRLAITGHRYAAQAEETVRAHKHAMIRTLIYEGYRVIVADTHSRPESIRPLMEIDPNACGFYLKCTIDDAFSRADEAGYTDLHSPILRISKNLASAKWQLVNPYYLRVIPSGKDYQFEQPEHSDHD